MVSPNEINTAYTDPSFEQFQSQITSQEEMNIWLNNALESYFSKKRSKEQFSPFEHMIEKENCLSGDLEKIYKGLDETYQSYMKTACIQLIVNEKIINDNEDFFSTLISFCWHINHVDARQSIYNKLEVFSTLEKKNLFYQALDFLISYDERTNYESSFIQNIVEDNTYDIVHRAQCILVSLCQSHPDNFVDHMNLLRERLQENFKEYNLLEDPKTFLCEDIVRAIGIEKIGVFLKDLDTEHDAWFIQSSPVVIGLEKQQNQKRIEEILKNIVPNIFTIEEFFRSISERGEDFSLPKNLLGDDIYDKKGDISTIDIQERLQLFENIATNLAILFREDTKKKQRWMYLSHDRLNNKTLWDLLESGKKEDLSQAAGFVRSVVAG